MTDAGTAPRRRARITRSGDFDAVYRRGRSAANRHLVVYAFTRDDRPAIPARDWACPCPARSAASVERNRVKRVLREQFATIAPACPAGWTWS